MTKNIKMIVNDGSIYHPLFTEQFKTDKGFITDFKQKNKDKLTPLGFCLSYGLDNKEAYDILFEKSDLSLITEKQISIVFVHLQKSYLNNLGEHLIKYIEQSKVKNYFQTLKIISDYSGAITNILYNSDSPLSKKGLNYHKDCLKKCFYTFFDYSKKHKLVLEPQDNFVLFLNLHHFKPEENIDLFLNIRLNFRENIEGLNTIPDLYQNLSHRYEIIQSIQEKYNLENNLKHNLNKKNNNTEIFKI